MDEEEFKQTIATARNRHAANNDRVSAIHALGQKRGGGPETSPDYSRQRRRER